MAKKTIFTVGHSTHSAEEFTELIQAHGVQQIADVRTVPKSRHNPQFWSDALEAYLAEHNIGYRWFKDLGGLRHAHKDSINSGWRNASFRGYADYMQTADFEKGLDELMAFASEKPTAIMCAEAVPWRCHRSMIGDALLVRGWQVYDIMTAKQAKPEKVTSFAEVHGTEITYPPEEDAD